MKMILIKYTKLHLKFYSLKERFATLKDISDSLIGAQVLVYWEEDLFSWFHGIFKKIDLKSGMTTIYYPKSNEIEQNINIFDLVKRQWIIIITETIFKGKKKTYFKKFRFEKKILDHSVLHNPIYLSTRSKTYSIKDNLSFKNTSQFCKLLINQKSYPLFFKKTKDMKRNFKSSDSRQTSFKINNDSHKFRISVFSDLYNLLIKRNKRLNKFNNNKINYRSYKMIARDLEIAILTLFSSFLDKDYREKYRNVLFNLNDNDNIRLLHSICIGTISASTIISSNEATLMSKTKRHCLEIMQREAVKVRIINTQSIEPTKLISTFNSL